ncbi:Predicted glycosyl hydrolase [Paenibacillus uliginis N3/975]|uniref:Predicted glycosyl hydrolase n=1 Tax=Paenibacillus uliginis N3/975 TaxID=1313296 RepID=A0A1X7GZT2_9BACL|nr:glycosyl hydrolase family 18 protein [Paenibacillus uliginis]SMF77072.1 Predicted glycosyl hydrolase [Paenibacillus uliginis N3/975]
MLKKIVAFSMAIMLCAGSGSTMAYSAQTQAFSDVPNDWAASSIYKLSTLGVISGMGKGTFKGDAVLTREAFVKMLMASLQVDSSTTQTMKLQDMRDPNRWSYPYIESAYEQDLIDFMIKDNRFNPTQEITREEVAVLTGRMLLQKLDDQEQASWNQTGWKAEADKRKFKDATQIDSSYQADLYYSAQLGMMVGDEAGKFRPKASLTRKEAAVIIERMINERIKETEVAGIGYYAIESFKQAQQMQFLNEVKFGWSELSYMADGIAALDLDNSFYSVPSGWESAIQIADQYQVQKELSVFSDNRDQKLSKFLKDLPAQKAFIQSVHDTMKNNPYGFTGISIDFEGLKNSSEQSDFVAFLKALRQELDGLTLSVTVPPTEWYKGYDLRQIGAIADQVIVMAYDYTHLESDLPSAPLPLVNETIQTVLKDIPKNKLVLGISKQANQWITRKDGTVVLENPAIKLVEERVAKTGSKSVFDYPYFLEKITFKDERGNHLIWYEDEQSIEAKIWLAKYYGLHGVSLWYMGNYTAADYEVVRRDTNR